jgi:DegV family protein with EDD domain
MNPYKIITDSTADLNPALISELDILVVPLRFTINGREYVNHPDGRELSTGEFYSLLQAGNTSSTSQITASVFGEVFTPILEEGSDILYIAFSSGLSGTCDSACLAAGELETKFPGRTVRVVDSLCASMGEGLLVYETAKLKAGGATLEEAAAFAEENKLHLCHWFTVNDLNHLKRGGRVSAAAALFGSLLGIKPVLHVDNAGKLIPVSKVRGRHQSLDALVERMKESRSDKFHTVFISHGDCIDDANQVAEAVKKLFKPNRLEIGDIGPVIGSHSGPGTVALFFFGTVR